MTFRRRLLVFGYPALELLTLAAIASWVGIGWLLLGLALGALIGLLIMQTAGRNAFAAMRAAARSGAMPDGVVRRHGMVFLAGALIAIPGVWCKAAGLALLLPPVQDLVATRYSGRLGSRMTGTVVVEGVVISEDDMRRGPASAGPPREIEDSSD